MTRGICILLSVFFLMPTVSLYAKREKPQIWDIHQIELMKSNIHSDADAIAIIKRADSYCSRTPLAVTVDKKLHFGPNNHYYCSMGPYRWPDPNIPGKYIPKDGVMNPDWKYYDGGKMADMVLRCIYLSKAFYFTGERKYYDTFIKQLRVWFLDSETFMEPNFEFSQVNTETYVGQSQGMIEAYVFNNLIECIRLVNCKKKIDKKTMKGMKDWFRNFADWSENKYGEFFLKIDNNISLAFDVTMFHLYMFSGENFKAKKISISFAERRINRQIDSLGRQPVELQRTRAFYYSIYNLSHIIDFCFLVKKYDKNYYKKYASRVEKAFSFLNQYVSSPESFPYQQITSWGECVTMFNDEEKRCKRLL